jgi:predicted ATPase
LGDIGLSKNNDTKMRNKNESSGITGITVSGYKSIAEEKTIKLGNLTILAGANSSGKSSMIQPLLLLKQTLELGYDPGGLLIDGNNVKFTSVSQLLSRSNESRELFVELEFDNEYYCGFRFAFEEQIGPIVKEMTITENKKKVTYAKE